MTGSPDKQLALQVDTLSGHKPGRPTGHTPRLKADPTMKMAHDDAVENLGEPEWWRALEHEPETLARIICEIDIARLDRTLERHASLRGWVNAAHEIARVEEERAKWEQTKARSRAMIKAKSTDDPDTGRSKVVDVLKAEVEEDPWVIETTEAYLSASKKRAVLRGMVDALQDRKDMLVQLSARQRREQSDY